MVEANTTMAVVNFMIDVCLSRTLQFCTTFPLVYPNNQEVLIHEILRTALAKPSMFIVLPCIHYLLDKVIICCVGVLCISYL